MELETPVRRDITATVMDFRCAGEGTFWIDLHAPEVAQNAAPGQFVMLEVPGKFLRRPFSIAGVEGNRIQILFRRVGEGTSSLARVRRNHKLRVLGPLGRGFPKIEGKVILIGGGIGVAPLLFAASRYDDYTLVYGERTERILIDDDFLPSNTLIATDDGTAGFEGTVVELAETLAPSPIFACGPLRMLSAVVELARRWNVPAWFSLEARMACGFGVCNGCVVRTASGYSRVCTDGPVFDLAQIADYIAEYVV